MTTPKTSGITLVTGGLSGIGAATVAAAVAKGQQVVVLDRAARPDTVLLAGAEVFPESVDISNENAITVACEKIESRHGQIHVLVNAAGMLGKMNAPSRLTMTDFDCGIAVDLRGTFIVCREVGSRMARRKTGAIVNVASVVGMVSAPVHAYAPAKAAVIHLTTTLAAEWGPSGVRVNCVSPGFTETPALAKGLAAGALDLDGMTRTAALRRLVKPTEVAAAIVWLLSSEASGVTGANLPVDAGYLAGVPWQAYGGLRTALD